MLQMSTLVDMLRNYG